MVHVPYNIQNGERQAVEPFKFGDFGVTNHVIRTRQTMLIDENMEERMAALGSYYFPGETPHKSVLTIPLVSGDRAFGVLQLQNKELEHAFSESDVRLLETLASSLSVALENARLFDETQRLYKESEQRAAELAVINSVQEALAAELNIQGIYDAVGDKIREIFNQADVGIRIYDPQTNLVHFPYFYEGGIRIHPESAPVPALGFGPHVFRTRETLVINSDMATASEKYGSGFVPGTTRTEKSSVFVPLVSGDHARGLIQLTDMDRENAFSESDVRLLQTLAGAMSVALENARLFDETQRLYKESEQRAAELAVVNSVQRALAAKLEIQGIYDAVGDKLREVFPDKAVDIRVYERSSNLVHYVYFQDGGVRERPASEPFGDRGFGAHVMRTRETLVINEKLEQRSVEFGSRSLSTVGHISRSLAMTPLVIGDEAHGLISLNDMNREHGFSESDVRLLQTLAGSMSVALENARLFDENMGEMIKQFGSQVLPGARGEKSSLWVPLVTGDQARGVIKLMDMNREHAFTQSDLRLLQTLANSMSVALENARLFDETQRLYKESEH